MAVCVDNSSVISNAKRGVNDTSGPTAKALNLRMGLLKDLIQFELITVEYVASKENRSNIFTKCLGRLDLERERELCGVEQIRAGQPTSKAHTAKHRRSWVPSRNRKARSVRRARASLARALSRA